MNAPEPRPRLSRRAIAYIAFSLVLLPVLILFREPIAAWFSGKPLQPVEQQHDHAGETAPAETGSLVCEDLPRGSERPVRTALSAYDEVRLLLANDSVDGLAPRAARLAGALEMARAAFPGQDGDLYREITRGLESARRLEEAGSLEAAREEFTRVSQTLVAVAACEPEIAEGWNLFECSMKTGFNRWMQREGSPRNPYKGTSMQTCGSQEEWVVPEPARLELGGGGGEISHWTCPMHPSVRQPGPGQCPICGMELVAVTRAQAGSGEVVIEADRQQLLGVRIGTVELRPVSAEVRAVGRVAFDETRLEDVTVKYGGYIGRLHVEQTGQAVKRGQTLFTLYSPELYAAQQEYLAALASQKAARQTSVPDRADYLAAAARQKLRLWDLSDAQIRRIEETGEAIREIAVPSPASGYVVEKDVVEGASVMPGMRIFRLAGLDRVWVEAEVYESELPRVRTGQSAVVTLPYLPGEEFRGRVSLILPALNPESRTGRVRIEIANRNARLKPEMYADVLLRTTGNEVPMVPESAVIYTGPRQLVFVDLGEGRFRQREVRLGAKHGDAFEVLSGLQPGDRVVTSGNFLIDAEARLRSGGGSDHDHSR